MDLIQEGVDLIQEGVAGCGAVVNRISNNNREFIERFQTGNNINNNNNNNNFIS